MKSFIALLAIFGTLRYTQGQGTRVSVTQDTAGSYKYIIDGAQFKKQEEQLADGTLTGFYSYLDPNGMMITYKYTSGPDGFRIVDGPLPVAPQLAAQVASQVPAFQQQPQQQQQFDFNSPIFNGFVPEDTAEVQEAKRAHFAAHGLQYNPVPVPIHQQPFVPQETPEVLEARRQHFAAHAAALAQQ